MHRYVYAGLVGLLFAALVCLLPAVLPAPQVIILEGRLLRLGEAGNNVSVPIYFSQYPDPGNLQQLHKIRTAHNGYFQTQLLTRPNDRLYLYILENGYTPVREEVVLRGRQGLYQLGTIYISKLFEYDPYLNHTKAHTNLEVFSDSCALDPHATVSCQRVQYFEKLRPVHCQNPYWEGHLIMGNRRVGPDYFTVAQD